MLQQLCLQDKCCSKQEIQTRIRAVHARDEKSRTGELRKADLSINASCAHMFIYIWMERDQKIR